MLALVDCNSFYASCEQIFRPDLRDKPVVVLSNNDGCIIARSKEAKALGIPDLQAFFQLRSFLQAHKVNVFSANFRLYGDISHRVMTQLKNFSPEVEVYSIDEMFLNCQGLQTDLNSYGHMIRKQLWQQVRMPVSVGIAPTKTLAKLANHVAKKAASKQGVCVLDSPEKWQWVTHRVAVKQVWGVGKNLAARLNDLGIYTAYQLATANSKQLRRHFSVNIERTIAELNGTACLSIEQQAPPKQQIYCTRSFGNKPSDLATLEAALSAYAARAAEKLRKQQHLTGCLQVLLNTSPHEENYYSRQQLAALPFATDDSRLIIETAKAALRRIYQANRSYLKIGIGLLDLQDKRYQQKDLFLTQQDHTAENLMTVIDSINHRYGQGAIYFAAEGKKQRWHMRQDFLSPAYTTRWSDLPTVKC